MERTHETTPWYCIEFMPMLSSVLCALLLFGVAFGSPKLWPVSQAHNAADLVSFFCWEFFAFSYKREQNSSHRNSGKTMKWWTPSDQTRPDPCRTEQSTTEALNCETMLHILKVQQKAGMNWMKFSSVSWWLRGPKVVGNMLRRSFFVYSPELQDNLKFVKI